ncbi:MAG: AgmX/PglI C-terminal domain-containing protein [Bacteriovoracaceae bacterium]|nr:AgmX/PglI C-terminal domain-containing protein [Bacteriovoracaceae bacterium]
MIKFLVSLTLCLSFSALASSETQIEYIRNSIKGSVPQLRYCYQSLLDSSAPPELKNKVVLQFTIGTEGRVIKSKVLSDEITSDKVLSCMENVISQIQFSAPENNKTVNINQPIRL